MEKEDWKMIIEVFKIAQPSKFLKKDENSYLMAIYACRQLKKWKWVHRFYTRGCSLRKFSPEFHEALNSMAQDLSEEESKKFLPSSKPALNL